MIKKLKDVLNTYTDTELEDIDLWVNSDFKVESILIDGYSINLLSEDAEIKINNLVEKEQTEDFSKYDNPKRDNEEVNVG
jgi:hypothetical protein